MNVRTQKMLGFALGLPCGLTTGAGLLIAGATDRDSLGAALVIGGLLAAGAGGFVMLRLRRPGDPL